MDNERQIDEIKKYRDYLSRLLDREIDDNAAARIWIINYARSWRDTHPVAPKCVPQ